MIGFLAKKVDKAMAYKHQKHVNTNQFVFFLILSNYVYTCTVDRGLTQMNSSDNTLSTDALGDPRPASIDKTHDLTTFSAIFAHDRHLST